MSSGGIRVVLISAHNLPGDDKLTSCVLVGHGENGGSTHIVSEGGQNPHFNTNFNFPYEDGSPIDFEVTDGQSDRAFATGLLHTDIILEKGEWTGEVNLHPQGTLKVNVNFTKAVDQWPPKATITIHRGVNFNDREILRNALVRVSLAGGASRQTRPTSRDLLGAFTWEESFDFDYNNENYLKVEVMDESNPDAVIASSNYDVWSILNSESRQTGGDLAVFDDKSQLMGHIVMRVMLWDPAQAPVEPPTPVAVETPTKHIQFADPPELPPDRDSIKSVPSSERSSAVGDSFLSSPGPLTPSSQDSSPYNEDASQAARNAEAANEAAKSAAVAAGLNPKSHAAEKAARRGADAAKDADRAAAKAKTAAACLSIPPPDPGALAELKKAGEEAAAARERAENAARDAMAAASEKLKKAAERAKKRASKSRKAASDIDQRLGFPELSEAVRKLAKATNKHANDCNSHVDELLTNRSVPEALASLRSASESARKATELQDAVDAAVREANKLQHNSQDAGSQTSRSGLGSSVQVVRSPRGIPQVELNSRRLPFSDEDLPGQQTDRCAYSPPHQSAILELPMSGSETSRVSRGTPVDFEGASEVVLPSACCYVPPNRNKSHILRKRGPTREGQGITAASAAGVSKSLGVPVSPRGRYDYDVTAYGVTDQELDILIEADRRNPICCICCGIRCEDPATRGRSQ